MRDASVVLILRRWRCLRLPAVRSRNGRLALVSLCELFYFLKCKTFGLQFLSIVFGLLCLFFNEQWAPSLQRSDQNESHGNLSIATFLLSTWSSNCWSPKSGKRVKESNDITTLSRVVMSWFDGTSFPLRRQFLNITWKHLMIQISLQDSRHAHSARLNTHREKPHPSDKDWKKGGKEKKNFKESPRQLQKLLHASPSNL